MNGQTDNGDFIGPSLGRESTKKDKKTSDKSVRWFPTI